MPKEIGDGVAQVACRWEDVAAAWTEDGESAFRWARKAAAGGIPQAQRLLGALYRDGIGTKPDAAACFRWTECAALNGDIRAQVNLAQFHENGEGTPCDDAKAEEWYSRVANRSAGVLDEAAESRALLGLARLSRDGKRRAGDKAFQAKMYRKAAEMGDPEGQGRYALALAHGEGVDQDLAEAARWYRRSAEGGNATSQNNLAGMYADGEGVEVDEAEAVRWYKKAAAAGQREAEYNLAQRYAEGRGVEKDRELLRGAAEAGQREAEYEVAVRYAEGVDACALLERAGRQGLAKAQVELGRRLSEGNGCAIDEAAAAEWFRRAADQQYAPGLYAMGRSYEAGVGVEQDISVALGLYEAAGRQEHPEAMEKLEQLAKYRPEGPTDALFLETYGRLPTKEEWARFAGSEDPDTDGDLPSRFWETP